MYITPIPFLVYEFNLYFAGKLPKVISSMQLVDRAKVLSKLHKHTLSSIMLRREWAKLMCIEIITFRHT
ncbi:hypothetical protein VNO77_41917 [Canavalia gladiata]|uniref:Uncharacterized protein n=1 Tax=Canavalia gladiata TaxID=3824 RepID=A0AAN9PQK1_CANGL